MNVQQLTQIAEEHLRAGRVDDAIAAYRSAVAAAPENAAAHNALGVALAMQRRNEALDEFRRAIQLDPRLGSAHLHLGMALHLTDRHAQALASLDRAAQLRPGDAKLNTLVGIARLSMSRHAEAIAAFRAALADRPDTNLAADNLLLALQYDPATTAETLVREHEAWANHFAAPLAVERQPHANDRTPDRRLRVGYVSRDFRAHAANYFFEPILRHHDRGQFEVVCYPDTDRADHVTARLRELAHTWHETPTLSAHELTQRIRDDAIDVLIDLGVHTEQNRLLAFAPRPAPVQLSYLGYCGTTGLDASAIDARLTDAVVDPPHLSERWNTEPLIRLPRIFCCYQPIADAPPVTPPPAGKNGHVTFGSFNTLAKLTDETVELWSRILRATPKSRLFMMSFALRDGGVVADVVKRFARYGVERNRLELPGGGPLGDYLRAIARVDVALDTFPFNGHTTTCHCLWMGVPVVARSGGRPVSRVGRSLLRAIGREEWCADDAESYVACATRLANDLASLSRERSDLRDRVAASPLCDAAGFTREIESAYRSLWRNWCEGSR
jgi:predicted O-linked N-acetylglucosamine transferase (SPINDLY family)